VSAYAKLRRRRQIFVDAYVRTGNASEAALAAGYSQKAPNVAAAKILANIEIKAAVAERQQEAIERAGVRGANVLMGIAELAYANLNMLRDEEGKARTFKDLPQALLAGAEAIDFNPDGSVRKIRLARGSGLNMLAQHLKLLTSVLEHQGKDGGPIQVEGKGEVSDLEKARRIAHLLAQGLRTAQLPASVLSDSDSGDSGAGDSSTSQSATSS
jgi:phage terminase small subunit